MIRLQILRYEGPDAYASATITVNPSAVSVIEDAPDVMRRLSEGNAKAPGFETSSLCRVQVGSTSYVVVGARSQIEEQVLKSKQLLLG